MNEYIQTLKLEFEKHQNPVVASEQKAYMRHQFEFYGLKAQVRRDIQKPFLVTKYLPPNEELHGIVKELWELPQRDFQLFAQELVFKYAKGFDKSDMALLEFMVVNKSWWDTVDYIAYKLMGAYLYQYPEDRRYYADKWLHSCNMWLQRSALLFQLKYKEELDTELLSHCIVKLLGSKEFFINKAIGWVLREYSKTNSQWVLEFVNAHFLHPLSRREALRLIK